MRSSIVGLLVVFAMACGTSAVIAVGGGGAASQNASQAQYRPPKPPGPPPGKPPCGQSRPDVPSVDKRFPNGKPPCPPPEPPGPRGHGAGLGDSFFDVFIELPVPGPPKEVPPPVPSVDKRFPPPGPGFSPDRGNRFRYFLTHGP